MCVNNFSICDTEQQEVLGCGLYLNGSVYNHSCEPNAVQTFDGVELTIRLVQDIPDYSWDKVCGKLGRYFRTSSFFSNCFFPINTRTN